MAQPMQQEDAPAINPAALAIAVEHPALSTEPSVLCAAARSCKAWREAVQQCRACNTAVEVCLEAPLSQLCSFARWLPKHAALVKSLSISTPDALDNICGLDSELHREAAQQLVQQALQLATALPAAAAAAAAAAVAAPPSPASAAEQDAAAVSQQLQQQQQHVRLPAISSVILDGTAGMLAALPAHSLTHLHLHLLEPPFKSAVVSAALMRLTNLQELCVDDFDVIQCGCLAGLSQLTQLTLLELNNTCVQDAVLQQLVAQPLPLQVLRIPFANWTQLLDLSHFTQLQEFSNGQSCRNGALNTAFPPQLQSLEAAPLNFAEDIQALLQLQQLRSLDFEDNVGQPRLLLRLAQLPALQQLCLRYTDFDAAAGAAAAWRQLPQLQNLAISRVGDYPADLANLLSRQQWQAICSGLAGCTSLTHLHLEVAVRHEAAQQQGVAQMQNAVEHVELCGRLTGLTNLKGLDLRWSCLVPGDALALTALTGLTRLGVRDVGAGVGDLAATAIASSCQQLRHLDLTNCELGGIPVWQ
uniref:F-box domain-containing protein n=1 Tax=Tetradesmus obliquus TaxID=3088 RepID=A0A383VAA8_TETOB|eukprot:jgi/Sobl393_1/6117/SZX61544.1